MRLDPADKGTTESKWVPPRDVHYCVHDMPHGSSEIENLFILHMGDILGKQERGGVENFLKWNTVLSVGPN